LNGTRRASASEKTNVIEGNLTGEASDRAEKNAREARLESHTKVKQKGRTNIEGGAGKLLKKAFDFVPVVKSRRFWLREKSSPIPGKEGGRHLFRKARSLVGGGRKR